MGPKSPTLWLQWYPDQVYLPQCCTFRGQKLRLQQRVKYPVKSMIMPPTQLFLTVVLHQIQPLHTAPKSLLRGKMEVVSMVGGYKLLKPVRLHPNKGTCERLCP
ncbi:Hypothetical predicted protein [Marmota monax]|uniref:Uncharacterized protein n=1 Tax=Marmota monax TaxID=9995 RepID=A0A5E4CW57_MARMO|nr:hypothetical protein GHT09_008974 [Marmota monax]VTJ86046.1 Hypothetical predicted protein [Marmota monax]